MLRRFLTVILVGLFLSTLYAPFAFVGTPQSLDVQMDAALVLDLLHEEEGSDALEKVA